MFCFDKICFICVDGEFNISLSGEMCITAYVIKIYDAA